MLPTCWRLSPPMVLPPRSDAAAQVDPDHSQAGRRAARRRSRCPATAQNTPPTSCGAANHTAGQLGQQARRAPRAQRPKPNPGYLRDAACQLGGWLQPPCHACPRQAHAPGAHTVCLRGRQQRQRRRRGHRGAATPAARVGGGFPEAVCIELGRPWPGGDHPA